LVDLRLGWYRAGAKHVIELLDLVHYAGVSAGLLAVYRNHGESGHLAVDPWWIVWNFVPCGEPCPYCGSTDTVPLPNEPDLRPDSRALRCWSCPDDYVLVNQGWFSLDREEELRARRSRSWIRGR
jgi:hypothetical protein